MRGGFPSSSAIVSALWRMRERRDKKAGGRRNVRPYFAIVRSLLQSGTLHPSCPIPRERVTVADADGVCDRVLILSLWLGGDNVHQR